jgi:chromosome segregation ATPase
MTTPGSTRVWDRLYVGRVIRCDCPRSEDHQHVPICSPPSHLRLTSASPLPHRHARVKHETSLTSVEADELRRQIQDLTAKLVESEEQYANIYNDWNSAREYYGELDQKVNRAFEDYKEEKSEFDRRMADARKELDVLEARLDKAEADKLALVEEHEMRQEESSIHARGVEKALAAAEKRVSALEKHVSELEGEGRKRLKEAAEKEKAVARREASL